MMLSLYETEVSQQFTKYTVIKFVLFQILNC